MDLKTLRDEFDRVVKKQEQSTTEYRQLIDKVNDEIQQAITDLQYTSDVDHKSVIEDLRNKLDADSLQEKFKMLRNDLKVDLRNYPQILGKLVETDISKAYRNVEFDSHIVNQIILNLLYHEGLFDVADLFITETQEPDNIWLRSQFSEMHRILDALLEDKNPEPAVNWTLANRQKLNQTGSFLEFDLRRLQFLKLLEENQLMEAVNFAKTYLSPLALNDWNGFLNCMGCLLWPGKLETSPYSYLWPGQWAVVSGEFMFEFCGWMGMFIRNPLAVTVDAGAQALPTFLKFANMGEFPVAVELGREFQFHSVFVCPVSCEQHDDDNPAVLLTSCGHVFSEKVISNLSNNYRFMFKCPNCRFVMTVPECRRLYF